VRQTPKLSKVQEHAQYPLSACQVWLGSDFTRRRGGQKTLSFLPAASRAAQSAGILSYSEGDFEFFSPRTGDTLHQQKSFCDLEHGV